MKSTITFNAGTNTTVQNINLGNNNLDIVFQPGASLTVGDRTIQNNTPNNIIFNFPILTSCKPIGYNTLFNNNNDDNNHDGCAPLIGHYEEPQLIEIC